MKTIITTNIKLTQLLNLAIEVTNASYVKKNGNEKVFDLSKKLEAILGNEAYQKFCDIVKPKEGREKGKLFSKDIVAGGTMDMNSDKRLTNAEIVVNYNINVLFESIAEAMC